MQADFYFQCPISFFHIFSFENKRERKPSQNKDFLSILKAADGNRTRDLRTTNATLYRLSHSSIMQYKIAKARDGTRTRDPDLGKVVLHQLSHSRIVIFLRSLTAL